MASKQRFTFLAIKYFLLCGGLLMGCVSHNAKSDASGTGKKDTLNGAPDWLQERLDARPMLIAPDTNALPIVHEQPMDVDIRMRGSLSAQGNPFTSVSTLSLNESSEGRSLARSTQANTGKGEASVNVTIHNELGPEAAATSTPPDETKLSRIETLYNEQAGLSQGKRLRQFGYGFFRNPYLAVGTRAADPGYVIAAGDEIKINTAGAVKIDSTQTVSPEGNLFFEPFGAVKVAGIRNDQLEETLNSAFGKEFIDFQLNASLGELRPIQIQVSGFVELQGLHIVPANTSLLQALGKAGGPTKDGSLRVVRLIRGGEVIHTVDLYKMIRNGIDADLPLMNGDTIQVEALKQTVAILGPLHSGIYEIVADETLENLVEIAGEWNAFTLKEHIRLERVNATGRRELTSCTYPEDQLLSLQDGDVFEFQRTDSDLGTSVEIIGPVVRPGLYPFQPGMKLSTLLELADGFYMQASLQQVAIQRQLPGAGVFDITPGDQQGVLRQEMIWVNLREVLLGISDFELNDLDRVKVFTQSEVQDAPQVTILGGVRRPGIYRLNHNMTLENLLRLAGGLKENAYLGENTLVRRRVGDDPSRVDIDSILFDLAEVIRGGEDAELVLKNDDRVVIRTVQKMSVSANIEGRVRFPGNYVLPYGATIADLLVAAGGLAPGADLRAAVFNRESVRENQEARLEEMMAQTQERYERNRDMMSRTGKAGEGLAGQLSLMGLNRIGSNTQRFQAQGRVVIDLLNEDFAESTHNLLLEQGDRLMIPHASVAVTVIGRVFSPNTFVWEEGLKVEDYLEKTGGMLSDADAKESFAILATGEVRSAAQKKGKRAFLNYEPLPGDTILVPSKPVERSKLSEFSDVMMVMQQVARLGLTGAAIPQVAEGSLSDISVDVGSSDVMVPPSASTVPVDPSLYNNVQPGSAQ